MIQITVFGDQIRAAFVNKSISAAVDRWDIVWEQYGNRVGTIWEQYGNSVGTMWEYGNNMMRSHPRLHRLDIESFLHNTRLIRIIRWSHRQGSITMTKKWEISFFRCVLVCFEWEVRQPGWLSEGSPPRCRVKPEQPRGDGLIGVKASVFSAELLQKPSSGANTPIQIWTQIRTKIRIQILIEMQKAHHGSGGLFAVCLF